MFAKNSTIVNRTSTMIQKLLSNPTLDPKLREVFNGHMFTINIAQLCTEATINHYILKEQKGEFDA